MKRKRIVVSDLMQTEYTYYLTESIGRGFHPEFRTDGEEKAGSIRKIPEDGFSGTAGIIWAADALTIRVRSEDGRL